MTETRNLTPPASPGRAAPPVPGATLPALTADLVRAHQLALWRYLRVLGCGAAEAEDLVQEAFVLLLQAELHDASPPGVRAWLRATVRNLFLAACRRAGRAPRLDPDVDAAIADCERRDDGDGYRAALRRCLDTLTADERQLLERRYRDGAQRAALAATADVGVEGLKSRLRRIKIRLRHCITRRLDDGPHAERS
ncbi:MAG: sigma-70 family RNA polymerase sigma factor [Planctomycetota bacterium]